MPRKRNRNGDIFRSMLFKIGNPCTNICSNRKEKAIETKIYTQPETKHDEEKKKEKEEERRKMMMRRKRNTNVAHFQKNVVLGGKPKHNRSGGKKSMEELTFTALVLFCMKFLWVGCPTWMGI